MSHVSYKAATTKYIIGFSLALALSVAAYLATVNWQVSVVWVALVVLVFAVIQCMVQLRFFLHLSTHERSAFKMHSLLYTLGTLIIIVVGSLWIMYNLDYRMGMSPEAMQQYMLEQNSKGF